MNIAPNSTTVKVLCKVKPGACTIKLFTAVIVAIS
jgi:hypothetical protein